MLLQFGYAWLQSSRGSITTGRARAVSYGGLELARGRGEGPKEIVVNGTPQASLRPAAALRLRRCGLRQVELLSYSAAAQGKASGTTGCEVPRTRRRQG